MKEFRKLIKEDVTNAFIRESSAFEFGIPPEHGGVRNALDNAKRLLGEYGLDGKIVSGGEIPVLRVFGDPQKVLEWAAQVGPDTYAEDYTVDDLEKEHAVGMKREMGERYAIDEVLMVRTQKTKDGDYEWLVQKVEHNNTETVAKGTEASRAKAMAAGKKAKKGLSEAVASVELGKVLKRHKSSFAKFKKGKTSLGDPGMEDFYNDLFDYFLSSGEMPYGVAKARTGDPLEWMEDRLMDESAFPLRYMSSSLLLTEELAYLYSKDGKQTFVVAPRDTRGMTGKQDKFRMYIVDTRSGKKIEDLGSHVSLKGAIKFGLNRGFVKQRGSTRTIKYHTSPEELSKSFRYDTLTGKKRWGESVEEEKDGMWIVKYSDKKGKPAGTTTPASHKKAEAFLKKLIAQGYTGELVKEDVVVVDEGGMGGAPRASQKMQAKSAAREYKKLMAKHTKTRVFDITFSEFREIETAANKVMGVRPGGKLTPGSLVRDLEKFTHESVVVVDEGKKGFWLHRRNPSGVPDKSQDEHGKIDRKKVYPTRGEAQKEADKRNKKTSGDYWKPVSIAVVSSSIRQRGG